MDRRIFLRGAGMLGCSAAAHPWLSTLTLAAGANLGEHRLVVVILRGAMDGLDVVQPVGLAGFAGLRPNLPRATLPLSGPFALHQGLADLHPLYAKGEVGFVHATSTPYRDKRSHFDGQTMLEAGTGTELPINTARDGWLNRMLQAVPGLASETAYAVGREALPLLEGAGRAMSWTPDVRLALSAQSVALLGEIWHDDDLFRDAGGEAIALSSELAQGGAALPAPSRRKGGAEGAADDVDALVDFAADRLRGATRIAAFSLSGWDTHRGQASAINAPLARLQRIVLRLRERAGPQVWQRTALLAMTEFGRTVRENGTRGTDHGTAGAMLVAGGAVRGGQVMGRWPGLAEADLYDRRDLMPTSDVRGWAAWAMRGLYGLDRGLLEGSVFPGLDMGDDPGLVS